MLGDLKPKFIRLAVCPLLAMVLALGALSLTAQEGRKLISSPAPVYPETAKNFHITSVVKVQVVIAPDGHIKSVQVIGGHPLFVEAVKEALKSWKYAPASAESSTTLEFNFHP